MYKTQLYKTSHTIHIWLVWLLDDPVTTKNAFFLDEQNITYSTLETFGRYLLQALSPWYDFAFWMFSGSLAHGEAVQAGCGRW